MATAKAFEGKANGGPFHHFFIFVLSIGAVGLIVLTALTAFGGTAHCGCNAVGSGDELASWYMAGGLLITYFLIHRPILMTISLTCGAWNR